MKALIQRVTEAKVQVNNKNVGLIKRGILLLLGIEKNDDSEKADRLLHKIINYRIFADEHQKMNLSLLDIKGDLLIVSQFTLAADTKKGLRPSFSSAASPTLSRGLYDYFIQQAKLILGQDCVQTGIFAANMQISLINDGPVTFNLGV